MRRCLSLFVAVSLLPACRAPEPATPPPSPEPLALPDAAPAPPPDAAPAAPTVGYTGLGAASVSPEVIARHAPAPLPADVSRRIQALLDVRGVDGGALTSDGRRSLFTWRVTGTAQVWRQDGPMAYPVQLTGGEDATTLVALAPDDAFAVVSRDQGGQENPGLYLLDLDGGPLVEIHRADGVQTFLGFVTDDSRAVYYLANDRDPASYALYRWDVASRTRQPVLVEPGLWRVADHRDGKALLVKSLGNTNQEVFELALADGTLRPLLGQGEGQEHQPLYGREPGTVLVRTNKLGEFHRVYLWRDGTLTPITPDLPHEVSGFSIDRPRARLYYTVNERGYRRAHALDARTLAPLALPALPAADNVTAGPASYDGRYAQLVYDGATTPPTAVVWDWKRRRAVTWRTPSTPELDVAAFAMPTLESFPARDGAQVPMFVWRPAACAAPCPVVVDFHGGPEAQSLAGFNPKAQMYVDAGFVFVQPNVRGSSGYGKTYLHADDGPKRLAVITDLEDVARHLRAAWAVDGVAPRLGVTGGSYGGYSVLMAMTYFAGAYDAGVSEVGISNLLTFLENTAPYRRILRITEYGDPQRDRDALVRLSPTTHVERLAAPLLVIQGVNDPRVPVGEALQIDAARQRLGLPGGLILFADEGHGTAKRSNQVLARGHSIAFLRQHLQAPR